METANLKKARKCAYRLIQSMNITTYPIDPVNIIKRHFIPIFSYREAEAAGYKTAVDLARDKQIDAFCYKFGAKAIIFYDEQIYWPRVRFSLMHELAHYLLDHHTSQNGILYRYLQLRPRDWREREADEFAGEILAPLPLLTLLYEDDRAGEPDPSIISNSFNISYQCAEVVASKFRDFLKYSHRMPKTHQFFNDTFFNLLNRCYCNNCGGFFSFVKPQYCPYCASDKIIRAHFFNIFLEKMSLDFNGDPYMQYKQYSCSDNLQVHKCLMCDNEDIQEDDNFCMICSMETTNRCFNHLLTTSNGEYLLDINGYPQSDPHKEACQAILPPNARYCPYCGAHSLYYAKGALLDWRTEKEITEENESIAAQMEQ